MTRKKGYPFPAHQAYISCVEVWVLSYYIWKLQHKFILTFCISYSFHISSKISDNLKMTQKRCLSFYKHSKYIPHYDVWFGTKSLGYERFVFELPLLYLCALWLWAIYLASQTNFYYLQNENVTMPILQSYNKDKRLYQQNCNTF
jgi:hypothetical protein